MSGVVFTVGNVLRGDDGAGPLLAELLEREPAAGWEVVDGADAPENCTYQIRRLEPQQVVLVDAADMGLAPGEIRLLDEQCVASHFLVTTHAIPLNFLINSLKETVPEIIFLGIQPKDISFCGPISPDVRQAVSTIHQRLVQGAGFAAYAPVGGEQ